MYTHMHTAGAAARDQVLAAHPLGAARRHRLACRIIGEYAHQLFRAEHTIAVGVQDAECLVDLL